MQKKIKTLIYIVCTLWIAAFAQILITRFAVEKNDMVQAFARNQLVVREQNRTLENIGREGGWIRGEIPGKLTEEKKQELAHDLFGYEGGACLYEKETGSYYVAYGYSSGIDFRKQVGGETINMNIAITYDEEQDKSNIYFAVPLLNQDF